MDVGTAIIKALESTELLDTIFGGSGQSDARLLFALDKSEEIETVIVRHEQAASFMACGYAMFNSDKLGVCFATAGPGVFNLFSGLAVAYSDSLPVLALSPYTAKKFRGKGDLGETTGLFRTPDSQKMLEATTKKSFLVEDKAEIYDVLEEAINLAFAGRPGPVNVHIDYNMMKEEISHFRELEIDMKKVVAPAEKIEEFANVLASDIRESKNIVAMLGYGCVRSAGAKKELQEFLEEFQIPFMTTMDGKGIISEDHPLALGTMGVCGDRGAKNAVKKADTVIAIANSLAKWSAWKSEETLFEAKTLMQINIDEESIGKVYQPDYYLVSDAKEAVKSLRELLSDKLEVEEELELEQDRFSFEEIEYDGEKIHPGRLSQEISRVLPQDAIILGDAGSHMMWLHSYLNLNQNQNYQNPGCFGPMAANVNASMGVKAANPDRAVIVGCGDGDYLMSGFELLTAVQNEIPIVWIIFNNSEFNIIKMFQLSFVNDEVYNHFQNPDYKAYAKACGALGFTVDRLEDFAPAFKEAMESGQPALIDVRVDGDVYPPFALYNEEY